MTGRPESAPEIVMRDRFQLDYLQLLDGRLASIENNVDSHHFEEARIAMLSLEAASGMIGAHRLVDRLRALRSIVDFGPAPRRAELVEQIKAEAAEVRRALETGGGLQSSGSVL